MAEPLPMLSLLETRVLGTLVEKQRTVPDTYPLSVNALVAGCNQKTSRNPISTVHRASNPRGHRIRQNQRVRRIARGRSADSVSGGNAGAGVHPTSCG